MGSFEANNLTTETSVSFGLEGFDMSIRPMAKYSNGSYQHRDPTQPYLRFFKI